MNPRPLLAVAALSATLASLVLFACKDLKIEDPLNKTTVAPDDETLRQDAAFTRVFNDTHCPRANTTLTRRPDIAADVYDVQACGSALRLKCTSESVATRSQRTGEHKAQMVYQCAPFTGSDPDAGGPSISI